MTGPGDSVRNFNVVIGHTVHLQKSRKHMQLQMHTACLKYSTSSTSKLLKKILENPDICHKLLRSKFFDAVDIVRATTSEFPQRKATLEEVVSWSSCRNTIPMDDSLFSIVRKYGERILLKESDRKPKTKKKGKKQSSAVCKEKQIEIFDEWCSPPPWDLTLGGDGCPKFLCDVMVEGLAKHLRCVGIDAAIPYSKKPESRELIDQARKENRVLLTRDSKLLRHEYLIKNQIYRVKNLLKNEQLLEVIETFQLKICEDQLMSRCTKCNGRFIQKPLTAEEASEAAKGFQVIPNCLFDSNLEFWQCMDCNQLYWEVNDTRHIVDSDVRVDVPTTTMSEQLRIFATACMDLQEQNTTTWLRRNL
uniref:Mut7-C RNAse domain-containing protein n=1 Tax=Vitis vinifera TaxID=29760 RepID=F6H7B8_VITVI